jgi:hypothetical protein
MRRRLWVVGLLAVTIACQGRRGERPAAASPSGGARAVRTNVLLVTIDTLRADHLGTYGYRRATSPRIDALAARGVVFERAFTLWPKTRASMIAMLQSDACQRSQARRLRDGGGRRQRECGGGPRFRQGLRPFP